MFYCGVQSVYSIEIEGNLARGVVLWRRGLDTLFISTPWDFSFDRSSYSQIQGIEKIDFSGVEGNLDVVLHSSMLQQAEQDTLIFDFGDATSSTLAAEQYARSGTLFVEGEGELNLSDNVQNHVNLVDDTTLVVRGGSNNDTIIAGSGGVVLDGGQGNDLLVAGQTAGADEVKFSQSYGIDTVKNFSAAEDLVILEGYRFVDFDSLIEQATGDNAQTVFDFGNGDQLILMGVEPQELSAENFKVDWIFKTNAAGEIVVSVDATSEEFNAAIANAAEGTIFVLEAGNHIFDASIVIDRDGVTIRGEEGADVSVTFDFPAGTGGDGFIIGGEGASYAGTLSQAVAAGDTVLTLRDDHGFTAGDVIYVQQPNTQDYLDANGWYNVSIEEAAFRPFRESILTIESVDGNSVIVTKPVAYSMEAGEGRYYTMDVVRDVSLSDFTVTFDLGATNKYDFSNTHSQFNGTSAVLLDNTEGVELTGLDFVDVASNALNLSSTINASVDNVHISGSHNKGGGGNGYGVELHEAFDNNLTNLEIYDVRHSIILSAWHAEVNNTVHVLDTNRDINLHGSPDFDNQIQIDRAVLDYDTDNGGSAWAIVSTGGTNHAATGLAANSVTFTTGLGSTKNERIVGADSGSLLVGGFGYDTLIGGLSNDVLIGGTRRDTMTGGGGEDTFLLVMGDDLDRITDFEFGSSGDTLIFSANASVVDASDLRITESGDDVRIRYGSNSTVILENTSLADIDTANFQFDPAGVVGIDDFGVL